MLRIIYATMHRYFALFCIFPFWVSYFVFADPSKWHDQSIPLSYNTMITWNYRIQFIHVSLAFEYENECQDSHLGSHRCYLRKSQRKLIRDLNFELVKGSISYQLGCIPTTVWKNHSSEIRGNWRKPCGAMRQIFICDKRQCLEESCFPTSDQSKG